MMCLVGTAVFAGGNYPQSEISDWFKAQANKRGMPCCDTADGHRLEDTDWRREEDGTYSVFLGGNWIPVPTEAVIEPKRGDPVDYSVVWIYNDRIICFRVGSLI